MKRTVSTRSSERLSKKAKLVNDRIEETPVIVQSEDMDDFQDPIPLVRRRSQLTRASSTVVKQVSVVVAHVESSHSAVTLSTTQEEEEEELGTEVEDTLSSTQVQSLTTWDEEVDELTEESDNEAEIALTLDEPIDDLVVPDIETTSSNEEDETLAEDEAPAEAAAVDEIHVERPRGRRAPRLSAYKRTQAKIIEQRPELAHVWSDIENIEPPVVVPIEQPEQLQLTLLPFQKYGVGWMIQQEKMEAFKGGILADEMGMGKTIQTIALLLSDKKKPNLVIAPTVAIIQWKNEIEKHTNNALKVYLHHGAKKATSSAYLKKFDVVLTTYSLLEAAFRRQEQGLKRKDEYGNPIIVREKSTVHKVQWHRIILDEAHNIKDRSNNTARSVFNLKGEFKWSLTGTPLQNRVGELYSLIRFMQADPFAYYYCKNCPCKQLTWKFSDKKGCDDCGHTPMSHVCWWNNEVLKPIQIHGYVGDGRLALRKLRMLLDRIMLRRTKVECADDLGLPPRVVVVRRDNFTEEEQDVYTSLYSDVARTFTTYVEEGTVLNNYANIFELLMKMRQCADHPDLVTKRKSGNKQLLCYLCNDLAECCLQYYESFDDSVGNKPRCPSCYAEFNVDVAQASMEGVENAESNANYSKTSIINRIDMDHWRSSTKIEALVEELTKLRREDKTIKSIVFSQFVNFLDLVYWRLSRAGFECIRLDGTMSPSQRDAAIQHLKAGGVALNLTEASRVFICDPWWNPVSFC
ncbi:SNF2 family N-terminal domain-containing protein [Mucor mucedo]|uniref:SNF2 family N-terminal domain-containing protein n=1 Tax=Mucor mucedo TaxID=29922 RepID=UPI00221EAD62|nr:SNF2 family N-terminal domain-containing protein [Mucor mucedo]KAI7893310.1 SNF2 family N-terminal domain-containing protein [Mucor mucedo]